LKLEFDPSQLPKLRAHPALVTNARGRVSTKSVRSVYYDTPELALLGRGLALRLRDAADRGEAQIQTVKTLGSASAGLFDRPEDEAPVAGGEPDVGAISDPGMRAAVLEETLQRGISLEPVLETETVRTRRVLVRGASESQIECVIDVGEVRTRLGAVPLHEVELELLAGEPGDLFLLAAELQQDIALLPATLSKPEKGFARLRGVVASPKRAGRIEVDPAARLDDLLAETFLSCTDQITANRAPALAGDDPEGVHQLRVGARRLRSALSLFREFLPESLFAELREELRWLGGVTGPARDLDVFVLEFLPPLMHLRPDDGALKRLRDEAVATRADAYERVRSALVSPRFGRLLLRLGACRVARRWREQPLTEQSARLFAPAAEIASELLEKRHKRVRRLGTDLRGHSRAELHSFRIEIKKLRYAVEFNRSLFDDAEGVAYAKRAARLQDTLGSLNDVACFEHLLEKLTARLGAECRSEHHRAAGFVLGYGEYEAQARLERLDRRWKRFRKAPTFWR
jgi:inorganic triphosphatase YgiF